MAKIADAEAKNPNWNSTAPLGEFRPYIPEAANLPEFTFKAVLFGAIFGIIFGAVTVYVGLRAGLTVSASIPIAVLSISLLRAFGKATILENNIVQTAGSAGESVAAGAIFTLPALIFMGFPFEYSRIFLLALIGGWIGVLFMIPLRRQLIVQEHGNLLYPEGTACADVLVAGRKGRVVRQPRVLGPRPRRRLHVPDGDGAGVEAAAAVRAGVAAGRVVPRGDHQRVSRRRLHHRPADRRHDLRRRRVLVAGADAGDQVLRRRARRPALSEHHSDPRHDAGPDVGELHPPDGRRRRRHGRPDHADEDDADDRQRAAERHQGRPRAAGRRRGAERDGSIGISP